MNQKVKILLYSNNIWMLGEGMLGPLFAIFAQRIGGSILDISWAWAIYLVVTGILVILIGRFSDIGIFKKEEIMIVGYIINAIFTFGYLLVDKPVHLFLVQAGLGIAAALTIPTWSALYAKHEDKKHDGYIWGLASGEAEILRGLAIIIGGLIISYFSFAFLFITMGIIQVFATIYQATIFKYSKSKK